MSGRQVGPVTPAAAARWLCVVAVVGVAGCATEAPATPRHVSQALRTCADAATGEVSSIATAIAQLNALPGPADVPCFVASLPRPLDLVATNASVSAQPAQGDASPRMFLLLEGLAISVVPEGDGAPLVEFGEWMTPTRTLKGEVELPSEAPFDAAAPYGRVLFELGGTSCGLCHLAEEPHPTFPNAFVSVAFRPSFETEISVERIEAEHDACVDADDPSARCDMFHALMDFGEVRQGAFSEDVAVFGQ